MRRRLSTQNFGHVEQIRDRIDTQNSDPTKRSLEYSVATGEGTSVRCNGMPCSFGASNLDHDDWFSERHFSRCGKECTRVADRFHINQDAARIEIVSKVEDQVPPPDIKHRSDRQKRAKSYFLAQAPVQDRRRECIA